MRDAFSLVPPYLRDDTAMPWFSEFGIQQSRGFKALKLWMALRQAGLSGYRDAIAHDLAMTGALRQRLGSDAEFEIVSAGPLSVTCFRYAPRSLRGQVTDIDRLNRRILDTVQRQGHVYLTGTELHGRLALRACIVNFRTRESDLDALVDAVRSAAASPAE
jgi:glutamate/tyrosine decarboxylase-like PLP-dependent enzyme